MIVRVCLFVGCLVGCMGCNPSCSQPLSSPTPATSSTDEVATSETKLVSLKIDGMTCPSGCYPSVKSAIAKQKGVVDIELAPQKETDVIDNPIVFVKYQGEIDLQATFKAIERAGFEAKTVAN